MSAGTLRTTLQRLFSTASSSSSYPYATTAIIPPTPTLTSPTLGALRKGKGLMQYLHRSLPTPEKQEMISTFFGRGPKRLLPGSILTVTVAHAPTTFSGVLISVRRRGIDTSFVLRNVVQRTGVEMQFFVNSPHLKDVKVEQVGGVGKAMKRQRRAKLFFLRDSPEKMTAIAAGIKS